jgi:glutamate-1-semialdehyde-2,1-aminomutase
MKAKHSLVNSYQLFESAREVIPSCTQTFSKGYTQFPFGVSPIFLERGEGSHVWDVDGNEYIDYAMALGPIILGHAYPAVNEAISAQLKGGILYSLPHRLEVELAEMLTKIIPCAEMVRFGKNGSDATSGAVRAARAFTGREKVACCGYHGWQDWYIGTTTRNKGVPKSVQLLTLTFEYNDIESLEKLFDQNKGDIAAVILEPVGIIEPKDGFLQKVKDISHENGAILIFDEIVTGFRLALGGAQEYFNVIPDLACFGKAMANGMPISAVVGKKEIMEVFDEIFFSFTFGGEVLSLAASIATIKEFKRRKVIEHLWKQGEKLKKGYNALTKVHRLEDYTECIGLPPRTVIAFKYAHGIDSLELKTLLQQEAIKRGVLCSGSHNICYAHSGEDIERTLQVYDEALQIMAKAIAEGDIKKFLQGDIVKPVFRKA